MTGNTAADQTSQESDGNQAVIYQIRIKGYLGPQWSEWFDGLTITLEEDGNTLLTAVFEDQAELHGVLKKIRDLGIPLLSVNIVGRSLAGDT